MSFAISQLLFQSGVHYGPCYTPEHCALLKYLRKELDRTSYGRFDDINVHYVWQGLLVWCFQFGGPRPAHEVSYMLIFLEQLLTRHRNILVGPSTLMIIWSWCPVRHMIDLEYFTGRGKRSCVEKIAQTRT